MAKKEAGFQSAQAALEFLTTYAWAFIVIMITIGALYYFGIFDFSKFLKQECIFPSQIECTDFSFAGDQVRLNLVNNLGEAIDVTGYSITNDAVTPLSCTPPDPITECGIVGCWGGGTDRDFTFTNCADGGFIAKERVEAEIAITYCAPATPGCPQHTVNGKITAIVS